jgi:hypothetical protein
MRSARRAALAAWIGLATALASCTGVVEARPAPPSAPDGGVAEVGGDDATECPPVDGMDPPADVVADDRLSAPRLLRRASLALRGRPPTREEQVAVDGPTDYAAVEAWVDAALGDPELYRVVFERAREWIALPLVPRTAGGPEYGALQQRLLVQCEPETVHGGAWRHQGHEAVCLEADPPMVTLEPWWDPGSRVTLVGHAAEPLTAECEREGTDDGQDSGSCGCGPHAGRCHPTFTRYPGHEVFDPTSPRAQRRLMSEEPARLFAHLVWHDRPLSDLVLGTYSVAPVELQAAYVMQGVSGGRYDLLESTAWWHPSGPVDPEHAPGDPWAWHEFEVETRNPFFISDRTYRYDPRTERGPVRGIPTAGALTSLGFLNAYPRERLRAARALETFACETFAPPSGGEFDRYERDPATEGSCQHCHARLDAAALHFKRFAKSGSTNQGWGARYFMPGVGTVWHWSDRFREGSYGFHRSPFAHWNRWYEPDTAMTPVTEAEALANAEAIFIDFLPPDQSLLGQTSDGTIGPLGFAKLIVASGAFDRCMVRRLHEVVVGRDIDPALEAGYLEEPTAIFVSHGGVARPFIRELVRRELFRRGQ